MSKDGRKASRLCMAGLIVSVIVLLIDIVLRVLCFGKNINDDSLSQLLFLILPVAAVIFSIAGIKDAIKKDLRGIAPAVYGIVISSFEIIGIIFWFAVAVPYLNKANTTPPDYTIRMHTDVESIRAAKERAFPSTESPIKRPVESNFHLTLGADDSITRDDHEGFRNLGWHIERNGVCVLERAAENELVLDPGIQRKYCSEGKITIYLTAVVDGHYQRVSNILEFTAEKEQPKESE